MSRSILFVLLSLVFIFGLSFAAYTWDGSGTCFCANCPDCNSAVNDNTNCYVEVKLTADVSNYGSRCINDPVGFTNKIFNCQGHLIDGTNANYGIYTRLQGGNTIKNCRIQQFQYGIYLDTSNNNVLINNTASSNTDYGLRLYISTGNRIFNTTLQENGIYDLSVYATAISHCNNLIQNMVGSGGRPINYTNETVFWSNFEASQLVLCNADNSVISNVPVNGSNTLDNNAIELYLTDNAVIDSSNSIGNRRGYYLHSSTNNRISNSRVSGNIWQGIYAYSSSNNKFINNTVSNSGSYGFYITSSSTSNTFINNTVKDNSNYGIYVYTTSHSATLIDNTAIGNTIGIYLRSSTGHRVINNTARGNTGGISLGTSSNNYLFNNTASGNTLYGFSLVSNANSNTFVDNTANNNGASGGFNVGTSSNNNFTNDTASGNSGPGIRLYNSLPAVNSNNNRFESTTLSNNGVGLFLGDKYGTTISYELVNVLFFDPFLSEYANISLSDSTSNYKNYSINWSAAPATPPPAGDAIVLGKYVEITKLAGSPVIEEITFHWNDDEIADYNESTFYLAKYAGAWSVLNNTPDTINNELSLYNLASFSGFGVLGEEPLENCPVIASSGVYNQSNNYTGAPNSAAPLPGDACVVIKASDVVFDCKGYSITHNIALDRDTYGILIVGDLDNVTLKNCYIDQYEFSVYANQTKNSLFSNISTLVPWSTGGLVLVNSSDNVVEDCGPALIFLRYGGNSNTIRNNTASTISIFRGGDGNIIAGNNVNGGIGGTANYTTIANNTVDAPWAGPGIGISGSFNAISGNTVFDGHSGIGAWSGTNNTVENNWVHDVDKYGVSISNFHDGTVRNNTVDRYAGELMSYDYAFDVYSSSNNLFEHNRARNQSATTGEAYRLYDVRLNTFRHNYALNVNRGFTFLACNNHSIYNNTVINARYIAFHFWAGSYRFENNTIENNTAINVTGTPSTLGIGFEIEGDTTPGMYPPLQHNVFRNNTADSANIGFKLTDTFSNNYYENTAHGGMMGIYIENATSETIDSMLLYNNTYDFYLNTTVGVYGLALSNATFAHPSGQFINHTTLTLQDDASPGEIYYLNWSRNVLAPLPGSYLSLMNSTITIDALAGPVSIDMLTWLWTEEDINTSGIEESTLDIYEYDGASWNALSAALDVDSNTLSILGLTPSSEYVVAGTPPEEGDGETTECTWDDDCEPCFYCSAGNCEPDPECGAECIMDEDCTDEEVCIDGVCIPVECECGYIESHACVEHECCDDSDCLAGYECKDNECKEEEEEEPEEEEPEEEEPWGIGEAPPGEEGEEPEPPVAPVVQTEVPSVESPLQPVTEEQAEVQEEWLWLIAMVLVFLAGIIFALIDRRRKKKKVAKGEA